MKKCIQKEYLKAIELIENQLINGNITDIEYNNRLNGLHEAFKE